MTVEFLGMGALNDGTETNARSGPVFDKEYTAKLAQVHEQSGFDRVLFAYGSGSPDPAQAAAFAAVHTESLGLLVAHRPNVSAPTFAAKTFATLDHISAGRVAVHFITGGSAADQAAEGDFLSKDERYQRTREYLQIIKKAWSGQERFDYQGEHYRIEDFALDFQPFQQPRPTISFGGSSPAAYRVGAAEADVFALWGETLEGTAEQIESIRKAAADAGRAEAPRIQIAFRPILASSQQKAWQRAEQIAVQLEQRIQGSTVFRHRRSLSNPENSGSQRLLELASQGERFGAALWTKTAQLTGGGGNSNALVGTPEIVAEALLEYLKLGVDIISVRGYDTLQDAKDFGEQVIPLVREEAAKLSAQGTEANLAKKAVA
ncbi:alkanesulfonate monooxygenase [Psychromicrobium silvestre]|uniref:Alkanesulfonate monooxygenase n=1 Tax=Psychromicrobium silvestre TaxID=1645614 RepID=A0A7Y9LRB8_9MICC|nr:LLM class flavin-dependent oxidoreductase [Psychromicrobium silvestre]NYE94169.1 alkanesulfonate monooxygenase [Psychromicrobium silvestre]